MGKKSAAKKRVFRGGTRRYVGIRPMYLAMERDWGFFKEHPTATHWIRESSPEERHEARAEKRIEPDWIVAVQVFVDEETTAMLRVGWPSAFLPTLEELEATEIEPGVPFRAVMAGARKVVAKYKRRGWEKFVKKAPAPPPELDE